MQDDWQIEGTVKGRESITKDWQLIGQTLLADVRIREMKNVPTGYGRLVEVFRAEWDDEGLGVGQVFQSTLEPGALSAWHAHALTTDRLFVSLGSIRIVLYDARIDSPTYRELNVFHFGEHRPALIVIPPKVYHGVQNVGSTPSSILNVVDRAYDYVDPDHYRLPSDSDQIPFRFDTP